MKDLIKTEFNNFKPFHMNLFNIYFHILSGIIFMAVIYVLCSRYNMSSIFITYVLILSFTVSNIIAVILTVFSILLTSQLFNKIETKQLIMIFFIFYFLPEVSHYLTGEKTVMTLQNFTVSSLLVNIFYLLPFSFICLLNKINL